MNRRFDGLGAASDSRSLAFLVLYRVLEEGGYSNIAIQSVFGRREAAVRDRRQASAMIYGVLSRLPAIDAMLGQKLRQPLDRLQPAVRTALRIGAWQLAWSVNPSPPAICDEACKLIRTVAHPGAVALVNGVLRALNREPVCLPKGNLGLKYGLISELAGLFKKWFGSEADAVLAAFDRQTDLTVRVRPGSDLPETWTDSDAVFEAGVFMPAARRVRLGAVPVNRLTDFESGRIAVQGEGSMLAVHWMALQPGQRALDVCAAPGSKTAQMADAVGPSGSVTAQDLHPHRAALIEENLKRLHIDWAHAVCGDASGVLNPGWAGAFDAVLADVPCSGLGQLGNRPELRFRMTYDRIQELLPLQQIILCRAAEAVKPGGRLVYSTCTLNPEENERQIERFLDARPDFFPADARPLLPARLAAFDPVLTESARQGWITVRPDRHACEGFFAAALVRSEGAV